MRCAHECRPFLVCAVQGALREVYRGGMRASGIGAYDGLVPQGRVRMVHKVRCSRVAAVHRVLDQGVPARIVYCFGYQERSPGEHLTFG